MFTECYKLKIIYLRERNCLRDKFSQFWRTFAKFGKLNPHEKNIFFFRFSELAKLAFLHSLSINDGSVKKTRE